jgi:hypothetical protein
MKKLIIVIGILLITCSCKSISTEPNQGSTMPTPLSTEKSIVIDKTEPVATSKVINLVPNGMKQSYYADNKKMLAKGDLNHDSVEDTAIITENENSDIEERNLIIYFGNKDKTYTQSIVANGVIMCKDCGGAAYSDPVVNMVVSRGSLLISGGVGSSSGETYSYRFQYKAKEWVLIGYTEAFYSNNTEEASQRDLNLITGDYILKKGKSLDKLSITDHGKKRPRSLVKLIDFHGDPYDDALSKIENDPHLGMITVSPDGERVFYTFNDLGNDFVEEMGQGFVKNLNNDADPILLIGAHDYIGKVVWSPDSQFLLIDMGTSPGRTGLLYDSNMLQIGEDIHYSGTILFSPDSSKLAYSSGDLNDVKSIAENYLEGNASDDLVIFELSTNKRYVLMACTETTAYGIKSWINNREIQYDENTYSIVDDEFDIKEDAGTISILEK